MNAAEIVFQLSKKGARVWQVKGRIMVKPKSALTPTLRAAIRESKAELVEYLVYWRSWVNLKGTARAEYLNEPKVFDEKTPTRACTHCYGGRRKCKCSRCRLEGRCTVCKGTGLLARETVESRIAALRAVRDKKKATIDTLRGILETSNGGRSNDA